VARNRCLDGEIAMIFDGGAGAPVGQNDDRLFEGLQSHPGKIDPNDDSYCARAPRLRSQHLQPALSATTMET
jgi:hypothetical protein